MYITSNTSIFAKAIFYNDKLLYHHVLLNVIRDTIHVPRLYSSFDIVLVGIVVCVMYDYAIISKI